MVLTRRRGNAPAHTSTSCGLTPISSQMQAPTTASGAALIYSLYFPLLSGAHFDCVCGGGFQRYFPMQGCRQVMSRAFKSILFLVT